MRVVWLMLLGALPCAAQFRSIEITFQGIGCVSCIESMPERLQRLRGVEKVTVDVKSSTLKIRLAEQNRVRLEQVRDMIEQDGTKTKNAVVQIKGELTQQDGKWKLQAAGVSASYSVEAKTEPVAGNCIVSGEVTEMHPEAGAMVIREATFGRE